MLHSFLSLQHKLRCLLALVANILVSVNNKAVDWFSGEFKCRSSCIEKVLKSIWGIRRTDRWCEMYRTQTQNHTFPVTVGSPIRQHLCRGSHSTCCHGREGLLFSLGRPAHYSACTYMRARVNINEKLPCIVATCSLLPLMIFNEGQKDPCSQSLLPASHRFIIPQWWHTKKLCGPVGGSPLPNPLKKKTDLHLEVQQAHSSTRTDGWWLLLYSLNINTSAFRIKVWPYSNERQTKRTSSLSAPPRTLPWATAALLQRNQTFCQ